MKKKLLILLAFISILGIGNVKAEKEIKVECLYSYNGNPSEKEMNNTYLDAKYVIYTDGTADVYLKTYIYRGEPQAVYKDYTKSVYKATVVGEISGECPKNIFAFDSVNGTIFSVSDDIIDECKDNKAERNKCVRQLSNYRELQQEQIDIGNAQIDQALEKIKEALDKYSNFDLSSDECQKTHDCMTNLENFNTDITAEANKILEIRRSNVYWTTNSSKMKEYIEAYDKWNTTYKQLKEEGKSYDETVNANCESMLGPEITEFINDIFKIIMIAGPVLALVLGTFDLIKALASGEEDAKKKATKKVRGRIIAAVLLFLVPYIVKVLLDLANVAYDKDCPGMQNLYIMLEDLWRI